MGKFLVIIRGLKNKLFSFFETKPEPLVWFMNRNKRYSAYSIGDYTYGFPEIIKWDNKTNLIIGKYCSIAGNVQILLGGNHRTDWVSTYPFGNFNDFKDSGADIEGHPATKGDVVIGNDVWLGHGVTILSGVKIGDGACIGALSVVTSNIPPYCVAAGNPIKIIRYRFDNETIDQLLQLKWWDWDHDRIKQNIHFLSSNNFVSFFGQNKKD